MASATNCMCRSPPGLRGPTGNLSLDRSVQGLHPFKTAFTAAPLGVKENHESGPFKVQTVTGTAHAVLFTTRVYKCEDELFFSSQLRINCSNNRD